MSAKKILVVEDEEKLAELLLDYLRREGFEGIWLHDGRDVIPQVRHEAPRLILLDLMLPGGNGLDICKEIRTFSDVPIIMVTARVEEIDRLLGLELGADDYVCKPFRPREVMARVKAVLRRSEVGALPRTPELTLDTETYRAEIHGQSLELTGVEFRLLQVLAASPGRIHSREQLMNCIYPDRRIVSDRTIDSHIRNIRRKIQQVIPGAEFIGSVYGVGYRYEPAGN